MCRVDDFLMTILNHHIPSFSFAPNAWDFPSVKEILDWALSGPYGLVRLYTVILAWTFIEGETIVILTGVMAATMKEHAISVETVALAAFAGSFAGDQIYYYIGKRYGTPLLSRWPTLGNKIDWCFRLVKSNPTLLILSFRFMYGIRNIAPFVIGISGVPRIRFVFLNFIAAMIWAHTFAWGGYLAGEALETWLGEHKFLVFGGVVLLMFLAWTWNYFKQKRKLKALEGTEKTDIVSTEQQKTEE